VDFLFYLHIYFKKNIMRNNFILTEDEKRRILGLYENPSSRTITEQYTGKPGAGYASVAICKQNVPMNVVMNAGLNWKTVRAAWGSTGTAQDNMALRNAFCDGWRPGDAKPGAAGGGAAGAGATGAAGAGGGATGVVAPDGVAQSAVSPDCINLTVSGSFPANVSSDPKHITNFLNKFMAQINANPLLQSSYKAGTLYVGGIKLTGGASNTYGGPVAPEVDNNYNPTTPSPNVRYTGDATKNKALAVQRANGLYAELQKQLPAMRINFGPSVQPTVSSMIVDTGGRPDSSKTAAYPNPGQIVKCEIDLCGVNAGSSTGATPTTATTVTDTGATPTTATTVTDTGSTPTNLTQIQVEILDCFKDAKIQVNYTGTGHKCNFAVYEIFVNGVKLKRTTGQDYASLNNKGDFDNAEKKGEHRFNTFIIDKITATSFVNKESLYAYKGNLQIDAVCVLKNPKNAAGWNGGGGCHDGVGEVICDVNGQEYSETATTPDKYGESLTLANFPACKAQYEKLMQSGGLNSLGSGTTAAPQQPKQKRGLFGRRQ
jgi:hypothetical protein